MIYLVKVYLLVIGLVFLATFVVVLAVMVTGVALTRLKSFVFIEKEFTRMEAP